MTRGDVDLTPVLESIRAAGIEDIVVWNNAKDLDRKVFGRYEAAALTRSEIVYTQDDDAICPVEELLEAYDGEQLLVNVPPGENPWLAWGAVFRRSEALRAFDRYLAQHEFDEEFLNWADVVFAHLAGWREVDLGHLDLPWATAPNRMYHQPDHYAGQDRVRAKVRAL